MDNIDIVHIALALAAFAGLGLYYLERRKTKALAEAMRDLSQTMDATELFKPER